MHYRISIIKLLVLTFFLLFGEQYLHAHPTSFKEEQIKAVFLYNLTNFITWSEEGLENKDASFKICVLGEDSFVEILEKVVQGESIKGKRIIVEKGDKIKDLCSCYILYISSTMRSDLPEIFKATRNCNVLTVGGGEGFASLGAMVNLIQKDNRMIVEINLDSSQNAGLEISSKLLNIATIVESIPLEENK